MAKRWTRCAKRTRSGSAPILQQGIAHAVASTVEPLERRGMLSSAQIAGPSVGFVGKSLTFNADLSQDASSSSPTYQWNLLNQYGSPYIPPGGLPSETLSSLVLPGTVPAGSYALTLAVSESGSPTQNATFPFEILSDPQPNLVYGTVPSVGGSSEARVSAMVKQPDGEIVVAGYWGTIAFDDPSGGAYNASDWFVAHFNPDLTLDTSFVNHHAFPARSSWPSDIRVNGYFQSIQKMAINPANGDIILVGTGDYNGAWNLQVAELISKATVVPDGSVVSPGSFDPQFNGGQPFDYAAEAGDQALTSVGEDVQVLANGNLLVGGGIEALTLNYDNGGWWSSDSDFLLLELTHPGPWTGSASSRASRGLGASTLQIGILPRRSSAWPWTARAATSTPAVSARPPAAVPTPRGW